MECRSPLLHLITNTVREFNICLESPSLSSIRRIATYSFAFLLLAIPATTIYFIGRGICCLSKTKINFKSLSLVPASIEEPEDLGIDIQDIVQLYKNLSIEENLVEGQKSKLQCLGDMCTAIKEKNDEYANQNLISPYFLIRWIFLEYYTNTNNLISGVQNIINDRDYSKNLASLLIDSITAELNMDRGEATNYVGEHFYDDENYHLTAAGSCYLLKICSIIHVA